MLYFQKGAGTGPQSVEVRDGKLTERGRGIISRIVKIKKQRGTLTKRMWASLRELSVCHPKHARKQVGD